VNTREVARDLDERAPEVHLLDARALGIDDRRLRERARALTATSGSEHVSRSYRYPYALVGWHTDRIGVDIERIAPFDPAFADLICTPDERSQLASVSNPDTVLASLWCSKEALAKGLGDALLYDPVRLESPTRWRDRRSGPWRAAQLDIVPGHVAWLCWRECDPAVG
jgi:hypothetical protein